MNKPPADLYETSEKKNRSLVVDNYLHDNQQWLANFHKFSSKEHFNKSKLAQLRILVMYQTMKACRETKYHVWNRVTDSVSSVDIDPTLLLQASAQSSKVDAEIDAESIRNARESKSKRFQKTEISVLIGDCLEAGLLLNQRYGKHYPVAVLNMANAKTPGGNYMGGSGAQEENLHRRTNLYQCLEDPDHIDTGRNWSYPLEEFSGVFTPDAIVLRSSEATGYQFFEEYQRMNFITVAAYHKPSTYTSTDGSLRLSKEYEAKTEKKIRIMLDIAVLKGMDSLILSAFGSGAYGNPPEHLAQIFSRVLAEYDGYFQHVYFAIFNDHNSMKKHNPDGNIIPYEKVFGQGSTIQYPY